MARVGPQRHRGKKAVLHVEKHVGLPKDEPSDSKHVHVEDSVKS